MKPFKTQSTEYDNILMTESMGVVDNKLVFKYHQISPDPDEVSTKMGKTRKGGVKFVPYTSTTQTIVKHKVYSVYSIEGGRTTEVLKAIKQHNTDVLLDNEDYASFINRTSIYLDFQLIRKSGTQVIIIPESRSEILTDIVEQVVKRNPSLTIITKAFNKVSPRDIIIDRRNPLITPDIIIYLEDAIKKANENGYFAMKEIKRVQMRKFILNFLKLTPDRDFKSILEDRHIMILDDVLSSGNTMAEMVRNVEMYSPANVICVSLFKT